MENQKKEIVHEVAENLKDAVLKQNLQSFSILFKEDDIEHVLNAVVCGKPIGLIFSLVLAMDKSPGIYKMLKTAIVTYENKEGIPSTAVCLTMNKKELLKSIFSKIHNG